MKKENYLKDLKEIQSLASRIKTIKESISFDDDNDYESFNQQEPEIQDEPLQQQENPSQTNEQEPVVDDSQEQHGDVDKASSEQQGMKELDDMGEIDKIRAICLDGMKKYCDQPEHPVFQALLKIFQLCNKSVTKEEIEENK